MTQSQTENGEDRAGAALHAFLSEKRQQQKKIALAVSGGPDSFALLCLAAKKNPDDITVLTVDHGLRAGSADEAQKVADWCAARGIPHETLPWNSGCVSSGLQAMAREARYFLLSRACNRLGIKVLVTAHHQGDQAETVLAALARGSGPDGLAAMAPERLIAAGAGEPVCLSRPLLDIPGERLKSLAQAENLPFSEDPSNEDPGFERIRRRSFLAAAGALAMLPAPALATSAARLHATLTRRDRQVEKFFTSSGGWFHGSGAICLDGSGYDRLEASDRGLLLARAIEAVGAASPGEIDPEKLALPSASGWTFTLGGALACRDGNKITIMREPAALTGRAGTAPYALPFREEPILFDKRMIVSPVSDRLPDARLTPLGDLKRGAPSLRRMAASLPVLRQDGRVLAVTPYTKNMLSAEMVPWNTPPADLHVELLTEERFFRRVHRFEMPDPEGSKAWFLDTGD